MPRVSERPLAPKFEKQILRALKSAIRSLTKEEDIQSFVYDFLTPQERAMLTKRLAVGVLLFENTHYRKICEVLKVTPATVQKIKLALGRTPRYQKFFEKLSATTELVNITKQDPNPIAHPPKPPINKLVLQNHTTPKALLVP